MKAILRFHLLLIASLINVGELVAQIQFIGPFGTSYNAIIKFDPFSSGRLFIIGNDDLYRSDNNGNSWRNITPPTGSFNGQYGLVFSASVPGEIYAVCNSSIYKSNDFGDLWTLYYSDSTRNLISIDIHNPNHLLAFTASYVKKIVQSTDRGGHWQTTMNGIDTTMGPLRVWVNQNFPAILFIVQIITYGGDVVAGTNVFKTSDFGTTWEKVTVDSLHYYDNVIFDPRDSNIVYLWSYPNRWIKTTDRGVSWKGIGSGLPNVNLRNLFISTVNSSVLFASIVSDSLEQCDIYISETGGNSWRLWGSVAPSQNLSSLATNSYNPDDLYATNYPYGIMHTSDGGKYWKDISQGLSQINVQSCTVVDEKVVYAGVENIGIEKTTDGGLTWNILIKDRSSQAGTVVVSRMNSEIIYTNAFIKEAGLSISTDGGISWQTRPYPRSTFYRFSVSSNDCTIYGDAIVGDTNGLIISGLIKSSDAGLSWGTVDIGISGVNAIEKIIVDPSDNETVYILAWIRGTSNRDVLLKSSDGGNHWKELADSVASFFLNQQNPEYLYYNNESFTDPSFFISSNGGETFQRITGNLQIKSLSADPKREGTVFALTYEGTFVSRNYGYSWDGFPTLDGNVNLTSIQAVSADDSSTVLFCGTAGKGILVLRTDRVLSVGKQVSTHLKEYMLAQNYPNPFNPSTNITFILPKKSFVSLKIYDLLGREVATLISNDLLAGSYTRTWNAEQLSSGVYFYRLQAGTFTETKKLILLK